MKVSRCELAVATYRLELPWTRPPLTLNQRLHWAERSRRIRDVRETVGWLARAARIPSVQHCTVTLFWSPRQDWRERDAENPVGTLKPACDGLVDAGIVPRDTPQWMTKHMPVILSEPPHGMWLTVELDQQNS